MIASLRGTVLSISAHTAVIECSGVGYVFQATPMTLGSLRRGEEAQVMTHLAVTQDAMSLYGFSSDEERGMFLVLQTVSGVGPKLALACVGSLRPEEIATAISNGDHKTLQTIPGVGKRSAERMVVELKDKMAAYLPELDPEVETLPTSSSQSTQGAATTVADQVVLALAGLGFTEAEAVPVVHSLLETNPELETASVLRAALTHMGKTR